MVLPFVITFYFMLSLLEDVGYLPRLAVLVDTGLHKLGLHGSAINSANDIGLWLQRSGCLSNANNGDGEAAVHCCDTHGDCRFVLCWYNHEANIDWYMKMCSCIADFKNHEIPQD